MYTENVIEFIKQGLTFKPTGKNFRKAMLGLLCFPVLGLILAYAYAGYIRSIVFIMCVTWIVAYVAVIILSIKSMSVRNRLIMTAIIYFSLTWQTSLFIAIFIISNIGLNIHMFILYLPLILIPALFCTKESIKISKKRPAYRYKTRAGKIVFGFSSAGAMGVIIGKHLLNKLSGIQMFMFVILVFMSINYIVCCEVPFNIMRLYYFHKLEKAGLISEESFNTENTANT